jgi:hypothetical protein
MKSHPDRFERLSYFFRRPKYPVIVDIEGALVAAKSARQLYKRLSQLGIVEGESYNALDASGEGWTFLLLDGNGVLSPINFEKQRTKLELIRWFNNRKNKPAGELEYPEKSLSSKRRDRIIVEISDRLLDAERRNGSLQD